MFFLASILEWRHHACLHWWRHGVALPRTPWNDQCVVRCNKILDSKLSTIYIVYRDTHQGFRWVWWTSVMLLSMNLCLKKCTWMSCCGHIFRVFVWGWPLDILGGENFHYEINISLTKNGEKFTATQASLIYSITD